MTYRAPVFVRAATFSIGVGPKTITVRKPGTLRAATGEVELVVIPEGASEVDQGDHFLVTLPMGSPFEVPSDWVKTSEVKP